MSVSLVFGLSAVNSEVITNEQAVVRAAREGVENNFQALDSGALSIDVVDDEISRPVEIGLAEGFENLGLHIVRNDDGPEEVQGVVCDVLGFEFKYENGESRGFLRKRKIKREFTAVLKLTFTNTVEKSIEGSRDITISFEDQINPEWADLVKSRKIPELDPPLPSSGLKQVAEPVIVTAAVGALIYLFFANR
jgi:hypothetical protein